MLGVAGVVWIALRNESRGRVKGQQAMAHAMIYPEPEKGGRGKKTTIETSGFSRQRLQQASAVLRHSQKLAEAVVAGVTRLGS